jgi:hypothetical protein
MILFYEGAKLCPIYDKLIVSFVKSNMFSEPQVGWPETGGQSHG